MAKSTTKEQQPGGIKGFFLRAGKSFQSGGIFAKDTTMWLAKKGATFGFIFITTAMVTLMPLLMEIVREGTMIESERSQAKEMRNKGYTDRQLQEMGFSQAAIYSPSVALQK
mmetsp:Transcript_26624/g.37501  ORF Transcript_26624/g.37501 Transcript_26624/m.37501 type:complete len:112 (-) Transcript_26624:322-657(-)